MQSTLLICLLAGLGQLKMLLLSLVLSVTNTFHFLAMEAENVLSSKTKFILSTRCKWK